jgi:5'-nucleotidase
MHVANCRACFVGPGRDEAPVPQARADPARTTPHVAKPSMNRPFVALVRALPLSLAVLGLAACADRPPAAPIVVKIIGFNDFHGNLESPGSFAANASVAAKDRPAVGGAEYLGAYIARLKSQNPLNVVVGAGDVVGASPLISGLFHDEPAVEALNQMGVEFTSVGNHEFDKGAAELLRLQHGGCLSVDGRPDPNSCKGLGSSRPGSFDGAKFQWLAANVVVTATGRTLLAPYAVKSFDGVKVAFVGMTLKGTPAVVTPTGVAGLEFRDEADTVNALVPQLRAQGVDSIVVLVHQGGEQPRTGLVDINGCDAQLRNGDGSDSDLGAIVRRLDDGVDLVISGHTHAAYNCSANTRDVVRGEGGTTSTARPAGLPNSRARLVPVTSASAYGRVVTDIDVTFDRTTHRVISVAPTNRLVDRSDPDVVRAVAAHPATADLVRGYEKLVAPLAGAVLGSIARPLSTEQDASGEALAGDLVADAQLAATQPAALGGAQIAFMNAGGVRASGFVAKDGRYPHDITSGEAFTVQPFGNSLVTMTLSAAQIKSLLEQQFPGCAGQKFEAIMQVSNGLRYSWSASAAPCSRIVDVTFTPVDVTRTPPVALGAPEAIVKGGVVLHPQRSYRVTVNNFMAKGGDGLAILLAGGNPIGGAQDLDALANYLRGYKAPQPAYDPAQPALGIPRITQLR